VIAQLQGDLLDAVQEDRLADATQTELNVAPVRTSLDDPGRGGGRIFDDSVAICPFRRLVSCPPGANGLFARFNVPPDRRLSSSIQRYR
jgi:hypothetical protein